MPSNLSPTCWILYRAPRIVCGALLALFILFTAHHTALAQSIIYVDRDATGTNNGTSWTDAYTDLQDALADATSGEEIWVAAGIYKPVAPVNPSSVLPSEQQISFELKSGVAVYGGFAGDETARAARNWETNATILSGDISNNDLTENGVITNVDNINDYNSYHVVTGSAVDAGAVLDGFTITGGMTDFSAPTTHGGGILVDGGNPTLRNLIVRGNSAHDTGGGIYSNNGGSPTLTNVTLRDNEAYRGGGFGSQGGAPVLSQVTVFGNKAYLDGGGILLNGGVSPQIVNSTIRDNSVTSNNGAGGGIFNQESDATLTNLLISGNAAAFGGGIFNQESDPSLVNVSISGNSAGLGGGIYNDRSDPTVRNSIIWNNRSNGNTNTVAASVSNDFDITPVFSSSLVHNCNPGGVWESDCGGDGGGNLADTDPQFVQSPNPSTAPTSAGNLRLQLTSPAIDVGNNTFIPTGVETELDGKARILNGIVDLGAYEQFLQCPESDRVYVDIDATGSNNGTNWADAFTDLQTPLAELIAPCEIWVAEGIYKPTANAADRSATFALRNGIVLYGGFAGTESSLAERDLSANFTILSGDIDSDNPELSDSGTGGITFNHQFIFGANSYHIVTANGVDSTAVLDGFVITGGQANGSNPDDRGAGIYIVDASPTLSNLSVFGNFATGFGGGLYNRGSGGGMLADSTIGGSYANSFGGGIYTEAPINLERTTINGNAAGLWGGGIHAEATTYTVESGTISNNTAQWGAGIYNTNGSNPEISFVTIAENTASVNGGGIYNFNSNPTIGYVEIYSNTADYGGGVYNSGVTADALFLGVRIQGNEANINGGGMLNYQSSPTLASVLIAGNRAGEYGGGMDNFESNPTLTNVTLASNRAGDGGGGLASLDSSPTLQNTLIWNNRANNVTGSANASMDLEGSSLTITSSLIQSRNPSGAGNLSGTNAANDPLFTDAPNPTAAPTVNGNFAQQAGSPIIDAGDSTLVHVENAFDLRLTVNRIIGASVDLGAYEVNEYFLGLTIDGNGTIDLDPDQTTYAFNATVDVTAVPAPGWRFADWDNDLDGDDASQSLTMNGNKVITAVFANNPPTANAGPNQSVNVGASVTLDGSGSSDADPSQTLTYVWTQTGGPNVSLSSATAQQPTFTAPATPTALTFDLVATDNLGASSSADSVTVNVVDVPVSGLDASNDGPTLAGETTQFSTEITGGTNVSYAWDFDDGSTGSGPNPSHTYLVPGEYTAVVTATNGTNSQTATTVVSVFEVSNILPQANAGPNQTVDAGATVTLDGSGSSDSDGDLPLTFAWTQTAGPNVSLSSATVAQPTFTAPASGATLIFQLVVTDAQLGASSPDSVIITVEDSANTPPTANAGPNQTVDGGASVTLDGSGSSDPDGDLPLAFTWSQLSGPAVSLSSVSAAQPTFTAPNADAILTFQLFVTDALGASSAPDSVTITVEGSDEPDPDPTPGVLPTQPTTDSVNIALASEPTAPVNVAVETEVTTATAAVNAAVNAAAIGQENSCTTNPTSGVIAPASFATGITFQIVLEVNSGEELNCELRFTLASDDPAYDGLSVPVITVTAEGNPDSTHRVYLPTTPRD